MALVAKNNDENVSKDLIAETKKEIKKNVKSKSKNNPKKKVKEEEKKGKYLAGVKSEMKKVTWPNFKTMSKYAIATLIFCLFFGLFFYGIDILFAFIKGMFK